MEIRSSYMDVPLPGFRSAHAPVTLPTHAKVSFSCSMNDCERYQSQSKGQSRVAKGGRRT